MSRPSSPHTGDLDAVLRDDLALEQIGRGRRPRGADNALKLMCAIAEDVEIRVPRRRTRGSRLTRGLLATTVAATVLGVTGVAAAEPGGSSSFALWSPRPGDHIQAADRSLTEAQRSLERGDRDTAAKQLDKADQELRKAGSSTHSSSLEERATDLRGQTEHTKTPRPLPTTNPTWSWSWGIPGGGPGWQPGKPPYRECLLVICRTQQTPGKSSVPQQTPGASSPSSGNNGGGLGTLFRKTGSSATPTTPGPSGPSPSSSKPKPSSTAPSPTKTGPSVLPTTPVASPSSSSPSSSSSSTSGSEEPAEPRPSATASAGG